MFVTKKRYEQDLANFERRFSAYKEWVHDEFMRRIDALDKLREEVEELKAKRTRTRKTKPVEINGVDPSVNVGQVTREAIQEMK